MPRNVLYLVLGALIVAVGVLGYTLYEEEQSGSSVEIGVDEDGVSIDAD